jgi:hypothetical protein
VRLCSHRHADANLARTPGDFIRKQSIEAKASQHESKQAKKAGKLGGDPLSKNLLITPKALLKMGELHTFRCKMV